MDAYERTLMMEQDDAVSGRYTDEERAAVFPSMSDEEAASLVEEESAWQLDIPANPRFACIQCASDDVTIKADGRIQCNVCRKHSPVTIAGTRSWAWKQKAQKQLAARDVDSAILRLNKVRRYMLSDDPGHAEIEDCVRALEQARNVCLQYVEVQEEEENG